jgi:LmbE family N-acetylglucosaminyl deacetylase
MKRSVLAFGAHPDDVEFMCAGTLALLARRGWQVHIAVMAGGEMGSTRLAPQAIRAQRLEEARRACAVIGAVFHWAGGHDMEVEFNAEYRRRATRVVRAADPAIVFVHPPTDYLSDHEETSRLVRLATFVASVPNYDCGVPLKPTARIPYLYYWDAVGLRDVFGRPLPLTCAVDIASVMPVKTRMLKCHASQRDWLRYINRVDQYLRLMRETAAEAGRRVGFRAAEGFIQHRGYGHPQDNILKRLLGRRCRELDAA